jgi:predicted  nucleic acid-binding Zn-ribbon protein
MVPVLASLVVLQRLDSAAEAARRRLAEIPAARERLAAAVRAAQDEVAAAQSRLADNNTQRRELEKQSAAVDSRLARFDDHKAAVKTNHEYTALLHEIETAKGEKDGLDDRILAVLEEADVLTASRQAAEAAAEERARESRETGAALDAEAAALAAQIESLMRDKQDAAASLEPAVLAKYEQLLKQRRMLAVVPIEGETCSACHVRLRPAVAQQIRRNAGIVQCDSCQRILYVSPPAADAAAAAPPS